MHGIGRPTSPLHTTLDLVLFKKSKIIEIGSVEKKLELREVGGFSKKSENPEIFVPEIWSSDPKTVPTIRINSKSSETTKSFLY